MRLLIVLLIALSSQLVFTGTTAAANNTAAMYAQEKQKPKVISKRQAISAAKRQVNGKVLSATLIRSKGPAVYRVKMLVSEKRVRTVFVDGRNGSVIRIN